MINAINEYLMAPLERVENGTTTYHDAIVIRRVITTLTGLITDIVGGQSSSRAVYRLLSWQDLIARWRDEVEAWHPTPSPRDSLDYAVTEIAEALDAALRMAHEDHDRTHKKESLSLGRELAQALEMIFTTANSYGIDLEHELGSWMNEVRARGPRGQRMTQKESDHDD